MTAEDLKRLREEWQKGISTHKVVPMLLDELERLQSLNALNCRAADESFDEAAKLHADNARLRSALERVAKHGCCIMHNDSGCPGCTAHDALVGK